MTRLRMPRRLTQREVRNAMEFMGGGVEMEAPKRKTGPQPENDTHKEVAAWRNTQPNLVLERNKRRLATPVGYDKPIMLGWMCDGSPDWLGWVSVEITPEMLGKRVAVFCGLEAKRRVGGVVSKEQETFLNRLRDDGGIAGVVRSFEDCGDAVERWRKR